MNIVKLQDIKSTHRNPSHSYTLTKDHKEKEMITFTTASKRINYLGINLPKEAKKRGEKQRRKGKI